MLIMSYEFSRGIGKAIALELGKRSVIPFPFVIIFVVQLHHKLIADMNCCCAIPCWVFCALLQYASIPRASSIEAAFLVSDSLCLVVFENIDSCDANSGANVVVNYAGSKDAAEAVAKEIEGMGVKAMAVKVCFFILPRVLNGSVERFKQDDELNLQHVYTSAWLKDTLSMIWCSPYPHHQFQYFCNSVCVTHMIKLPLVCRVSAVLWHSCHVLLLLLTHMARDIRPIPRTPLR